MTAGMEATLAARDAAMDQVESAADPQWLAAALVAVRRTCEKRATFIVDDVWNDNPELARPAEARAMGPVVRRAVKAGWCEKCGYSRTRQVASHAAPRTLWKSNLFTGDGSYVASAA